MSRRPWLRYPPRHIRPTVCPTGMPRFASTELARQALIHGLATVALTAVACEVCGGAHLIDQPPTRPEENP